MKGSTGRKMLIKSAAFNEIVLRDRNQNMMVFSVGRDEDYLSSKFILPSIEMIEDNDEDTTWQEIGQNIQNMALSLSMAIYDRKYGM